MRLMNYLVLWLVTVTLLCLLGAVAWSLVDAHRSVEASAAASADRIQRQLQALYWQKLVWRHGMSRETLVPQPDWETIATLDIISPGVCVTFNPPQGGAQRLCSQVDALGAVAPAWFATLDGWLFGQHRSIVKQSRGVPASVQVHAACQYEPSGWRRVAVVGRNDFIASRRSATSK